MAGKPFFATLAAVLLGILSFSLAFFLLLWFGFFYVYFGAPGADGRWPAPRLHDALLGVTSAGVLALLVGWGALAAGAGVLGSVFATENESRVKKTSFCSLSVFLSELGMNGTGVAAVLLVGLILLRFVLRI